MWTMERRARTSGLRRSRTVTTPRLGELFNGYLSPRRPHAGAYDEMFSTDNGVRSAYRALYESVAPSQVNELNARSEALGRLERGEPDMRSNPFRVGWMEFHWRATATSSA